MSREEAIKQLEVYRACINADGADVEAYNMAIQALGQEPCDDVISREYLFKVLDDFCGHDRTATITLDTLADLVYDMPPVKTQNPCNDAISRQAVLDIVNNPLNIRLDEIIKGLPSVKPQKPKTGHWITIPFGNNHGEYRPNKYACSECGWEIDLCRGLQQDTGHRLFCEHCGAKMVEPQESEG